jgi:transcriptional regulator of acetoin/glycerol metabolism
MASTEEAARDLEQWAIRDEKHQLQRDQLVRAAAAAGVNVRQIALKSGLSRTTVYKIIGEEKS